MCCSDVHEISRKGIWQEFQDYGLYEVSKGNTEKLKYNECRGKSIILGAKEIFDLRVMKITANMINILRRLTV